MEEIQKSVIEKWREGDQEAFEKIVRLYMSDAYLTALAFVRNEDDARDLSQEAFIKVYQARKSFDPTRPFYPWFYRILKNHCLNFIRRFSRKYESIYYENNPDRERLTSKVPTPIEHLEGKERRAFLLAAIDRVSIEHREIIILKNFKEYSYQEISDILEIPMGTVMSRLYYARKRLKEMISEFEKKGLPESGVPVLEGNASPGEVV